MPKTKLQKTNIIAVAEQELEKSSTIIIADFTGLKTHELTALRRALREVGARMTVIKKRLVKLILEHAGFVFARENFPGQTGVIFSSSDIISTAAPVYKFAKAKEAFKVLGGFDIKEKKPIDASDIIRLGSLPPREILLGQLVGMLTTPIRQLLFVLDQTSKKTVETK